MFYQRHFLSKKTNKKERNEEKHMSNNELLPVVVYFSITIMK